MIVFNIETFDTTRCVPDSNCKYKLSTLSGRHNRDVTERKYQKSSNDCIVFKGLDNNNKP